MTRDILEALKQALTATPNNHLLRQQIINALFDFEEYNEAKNHLKILLQHQPNNTEVKLQMAKCFYYLEQSSAGIIICEELINEQTWPALNSLYIKLLIQDRQLNEAVQQYQKLQVNTPGWRDETLEDKLKIRTTIDENQEEGEEENHFLEIPDLDFSKVGGMENVKEEIRIKIIQPLQNPDLFKAFGKKAGGGILMYGPPGCGKTYLSKATAGEIKSNFISVGIDEVMDMWVGNSEKNLRQKFEIARQNAPCVLFFDEIDALGSKRNDLRQSAGRNLINQFLKELDGINSDNEGVLVLGATNSPWHMDTAFLRPGRFDRIIFVPPPDVSAREKIVELLLEEKPIDNIDYKKIAAKAKEFSGADLMALIDMAVEEKLRKSMASGKIEKLNTKDLLNPIKKVRPSTKDWFNTARNYALYSNASGLYNDILSYLKL